MIETKRTVLDARCSIILLVFVNLVAFTQRDKWLEMSLFLYLYLLMLLCGCFKQCVKWFLVNAGVLILEHVILPMFQSTVLSGFTVMLPVMLKIIPCLMLGTIIVKKIPTHYLILGLRRFHLPMQVLIPLSVTVRYIPSIKIESSLSYDAMKLRCIGKMERLECILTSLIMNAISITNELSAAAVTRGIENPCKKTSILEMKFGILDWVSIGGAALLCVWSILTIGVC